MKHIFFAILMILALATLSMAGGRMVQDLGKNPIQEFSPTGGHGYESKTKGTTVVRVKGTAKLRYQCTSDCTYKINGVGYPWKVKAGVVETITIPPMASDIAFDRTSSATATVIYTQGQK